MDGTWCNYWCTYHFTNPYSPYSSHKFNNFKVQAHLQITHIQTLVDSPQTVAHLKYHEENWRTEGSCDRTTRMACNKYVKEQTHTPISHRKWTYVERRVKLLPSLPNKRRRTIILEYSLRLSFRSDQPASKRRISQAVSCRTFSARWCCCASSVSFKVYL